ncbi:MAG: energy transducer TonB [Synechococcales cyanobacterium M58_A2018_015]|nr:energy transducer TonB [Synechococcales cyanobacterium M58_A2018_015]
MAFSEEAEQQRRREVQTRKRFIGFSVVGATLLHAVLLALAPVVFQTVRKSPPVEVTIVPRRVPPVSEEPPEPLPEELSEPPLEPQDNPLTPPLPSPAALPELPVVVAPAGAAPEGDPDAATDESPLVGSGLAPGTGGFSEGIGLNRSDSPIRGAGGGARRGVPGGVPGSTPEPPVVTAPPAPQLEVTPEGTSVRRAVCRRCPEPNYPRAALRANREGRVQVAVDVDAQGRVVDVRLANSSGDQTLDTAVLETVRNRWRFEAISGGASNIPVEVYMTVDGSELNQQARSWGEQTAVEIPDSGFAAPAVSPASTTAPLTAPTTANDANNDANLESSFPTSDLDGSAPQPNLEVPATPPSGLLNESLNEQLNELNQQLNDSDDSSDELPDDVISEWLEPLQLSEAAPEVFPPVEPSADATEAADPAWSEATEFLETNESPFEQLPAANVSEAVETNGDGSGEDVPALEEW